MFVTERFEGKPDLDTRQQLLPLELPTHYDKQNLYIGEHNKKAWQWIEEWPAWPTKGIVIYGPEGSGKTHLGHVWQSKAGAKIWTPETHYTLMEQVPQKSGVRHVLIDGPDAYAHHMDKGRLLLECYNILHEYNGTFLVLARTPTARWELPLRDLSSRLSSLLSIPIDHPNDQVLAALVRKQFQDYQITISDDALMYLLTHSGRSFAAIHKTVSQLNELSLHTKRKVSYDMLRHYFKKEKTGDAPAV